MLMGKQCYVEADVHINKFLLSSLVVLQVVADIMLAIVLLLCIPCQIVMCVMCKMCR